MRSQKHIRTVFTLSKEKKNISHWKKSTSIFPTQGCLLSRFPMCFANTVCMSVRGCKYKDLQRADQNYAMLQTGKEQSRGEPPPPGCERCFVIRMHLSKQPRDSGNYSETLQTGKSQSTVFPNVTVYYKTLFYKGQQKLKIKILCWVIFSLLDWLQFHINSNTFSDV